MGISNSLANCEELSGEELSGEELSAVNGDVGGRSLVFIFDMGGVVVDGLRYAKHCWKDAVSITR